MGIEPRNDYVLIERLPNVEYGAIIIPDIAKEKGIKGKVLAIGPKVEEIKPGDSVLFNSKWDDLSGTHYHDDAPVHFERNVHLVQEADVFCLINA